MVAVRETSLLPIPSEDEYIEMITSCFNDKLLFDPSDERMVYTVRDPVSNRVYGAENPRGYAQRSVLGTAVLAERFHMENERCLL